MKKYIVFLVALLTTLSSCAQKQTNISSMNIKNQEITFSNVVNKTIKHVKHYEREPMYFIRPVQNNCIYEILVNDFPIFKDFSLDIMATPIEINSNILKSGKQTLTVRMYPIGDLLKDNYDIGETVTTLLDNSNMKVEVVKYEAYNISNGLDDERTVITHYSPTLEGTKKFKGAGLPYYEYTFSFDAEVPYIIEGWQNGQDLTKFDKEALDGQVKKYYGQVKEIYLNEDIDALAKISFGGFLIIAKSKYYKKQDIIEMADYIKENIVLEKKDFGNIENTKLMFYGNGKIVSLRHSSLEPVDRKLRGKSALWFKYERGNNIMGLFPGVDLYLPKGEPLENLRMID